MESRMDSDGTDGVDLPHGLALLRRCAQYARAVMRERNGQGGLVKQSSSISFDLRVEVDKVVDRVLEAWKNKGESLVKTCLVRQWLSFLSLSVSAVRHPRGGTSLPSSGLVACKR